MAKIKQTYYCSNCGAESIKWVGKCPVCAEWNSFKEMIVRKEEHSGFKTNLTRTHSDNRSVIPVSIETITAENAQRLHVTDSEFNRVLGGGIVPGAVVLVGGEPGIGKSTLLLQIALQDQRHVLYISGEESVDQIKLRAERLGHHNPNCLVYTETDIAKVIHQANETDPEVVIVDSIQTLFSPAIDSLPGSISQIKECAGLLQRFAKQRNVPVFIIGHINKEGAIAGPKVLEHMVDVVLQFEGDRHYSYRMVRTLKNRFGSTMELGIYEMNSHGLSPVDNPSELLLSQLDEALSGNAIACTIEGVRPLMIETQALVSTAVYSTAQRSSTGFDIRRLSMLLAVLEKRCGFYFGQNDVFLNIAGGMKLDDPSIDLAVVTAILSSLTSTPLSNKDSFTGEIGLSGEIRAVPKVVQRVAEAERLGFERIFLSKYNKGLKSYKGDITIEQLGTVDELNRYLFVE